MGHTVIDSKVTDTMRIDTIKTDGGATVICRIPIHPPEIQKKVDEDIVEALVRFANPNMDFSKVRHMELII